MPEPETNPPVTFFRSINARFALLMLILLLLSLAFVAGNVFMISRMGGATDWLRAAGEQKANGFLMLEQAEHMVRIENPGERSMLRESLRATMTEIDATYVLLVDTTHDARVLDSVESARERWKDRIKPKLQALLTLKSEEISGYDLASLDLESEVMSTQLDDALRRYDRQHDETEALYQNVQYLFILTALIVFVIVSLLARRITQRLGRLAHQARSIAEGALETPVASSARDEIGMLSRSLSSMANALLEGLRRSEAMVNAAVDGFFTIDHEGTILTVNDGGETLFGYRREELVGNNVKMLMPSPHRENHDGYLERYLSTGVAKVLRREREVEGLRKNGDTFPMALWVTELRDDSGERNFVGVCRDIGKRKLQESERERVLDTIRATAGRLASASEQILASVTSQASGAQQQASAVAETVATIDQVTQTAEQAAQRARSVASSARRSSELGQDGREAVEHTIQVMTSVNERSLSVARSILGLAEQAQAIGEIITSVNEVAEQTNLLALNASIEASRAGEHGRGFSVVAGEVKVLAEQAKKSTVQVRQLLLEIQKATNSAVLATEEGSKSVGKAMVSIEDTGTNISELGELLGEASDAAAQIAASASQQANGMLQIHEAMQLVKSATHQHVASSREVELAARDINVLAGNLRQLLVSIGD